ncbi:MAG: peptidoglycan DD-metalloendopeptidase family protein [Bacteroidota bacterium]
MNRHAHTGRILYSNILLMVLLSLFLTSAPAQTAKEKERLQQTKKQLEQEIRYTTELLEKTKKNKQSSLNKIEILAKQIRSRQALINNINLQLDNVQVQISVENIQIERMTKQLSDLKTEYARMIYYAYRTMNGHNKLMFIFSARDFNQAYQRLKYYQQYSSYRRTQVARIESTKHAIDNHRRELEAEKTQKLTLVQSQQLEKQKLDHEKTEKTAAVQEFSSKEKQLVSTLKKKQQAAQKLESEIEKMIADDIKASEERSRKRAARTSKPAIASKTPATGAEMEFTPVEKELSSSFSANRGRLPWPCDRGVVSGSFGEHFHPVLEHYKVQNNGIDIMTGQESVVKAVFKGRVSRIVSFPLLNNVVIIRHGDYLTVYSNLGEVHVREGQEVAARQDIGKVHSNPDEQKSELHFELWRGKVIQNPEDWLAKK